MFFIEENRRMEEIVTEDNDLPFSYDVVNMLERTNDDSNDSLQKKWTLIEKGSEKSKEIRPLSFYSIRMAMCDIRKYIWRTAHNKLRMSILKERGFKVYLKEELYQITETVKARGVVYTLLQLSDEQKSKGVIAVSTGNFGRSLCYFGKKFGIPVTVVMPRTTIDENIMKCQNYADSLITVIVQGDDITEAHQIALCIARKKGLTYIDGNDNPNMIIGQATLGIEILELTRKIDAILLPTMNYSCGLTIAIAMVIKIWKPEIKIIEVRTADYETLVETIRIYTQLFDELDIPWKQHEWLSHKNGILNVVIDKIVTVTEQLLIDTNNRLLSSAENNANIDYHATMGLAAILSGELDELRGKRVLLPLYGQFDSINDMFDDQLLPQLPESP